MYVSKVKFIYFLFIYLVLFPVSACLTGRNGERTTKLLEPRGTTGPMVTMATVVVTIEGVTTPGGVITVGVGGTTGGGEETIITRTGEIIIR